MQNGGRRQNHTTLLLKAVLAALCPIWMRQLFFRKSKRRGVDKPVTRQTDFIRDLGIFRKTYNVWPMGIIHSVIGVLPLFGTQSFSETKFSLKLLFVEVPYLLFWDLIGFFLFVFSFIPILCIIYPGVTWLVTFLAFFKNELQWRINHPNGKQPNWFYINGVMNSESTAQCGVERINQLFGADTFLLYNPTQGMLTDLLECFLARDLQWITVPGLMSYRKIKDALTDPSLDKVVVFGHSQGCIIAADVLQYLKDDLKHGRITEQELKKLEVYMFASPADTVTTADGRIYVEFFANKTDLVSCIGVLADPKDLPKAVPQGAPVFVQDLHGHLLVEHHLRDDFPQRFKHQTAGGKVVVSRLKSYLKPVPSTSS